MGLNPPVIGPGEEIPPGSVIVDFEYLTPLDDATCRDHIRQNLARRLPEALTRKKLTVIASGPSAKYADLRCLSDTLALNGALKLFTNEGLHPTFWACCDPQEIVSDFLPDNPPKETVYVVASKCHPKVFDKLKDRYVVVWHLRDYDAEGRSRIALASSVTISATWLMHRGGYTDFEYWGWDGCFMDGKHHATSDSDWSKVDRLHLNYGGELKDGEIIGGRIFETTRTWAAEAKGAEQFFQLAEYFDMKISIYGDGMFEAARKLLMET